MKVCPQCRGRFADDVGRCPGDGSILIPEAALGNPSNASVTPVDEGAETRMFDVESLREELNGPTAQAGHVAHGEQTLSDGSTRVLDQDQVEQVLQGTATGVDPRTNRSGAKPPKRPSGQGLRFGILALIAAGLFVAILVTGLVLLFWPKATELSITTAPSGASVEVDEVLSGETPVSVPMSPGPHMVTLSHPGFQSFAQIIEVPRGGRSLTVALVRKEQPEPEPEPEPRDNVDTDLKARTDAIFNEVQVLEQVGDFELADARLQVLAVMVPDDPRVPEALKHLAELRAKAPDKKDPAHAAGHGVANGQGKKPTAAQVDPSDPNPASMTKAQRERYADKLFQKGRRLYRGGKFAQAKELLLKSLRYDARFYPPHRALARIYNREKKIDKAKYHLSRYIELGGSDKDYKIRQWLATH